MPAVCQGLGEKGHHPYWRKMGVCLHMATHGGSPWCVGTQALALGAPDAPACLFLQMDPLVPSPKPCSGPGERCFLRQPWLWPLQLEHPGGGGKRNRAMGWGLGPVVWLEFFHSPRQKLSNFKREGSSAKLRERGFFPRTLAGSQRLMWPLVGGSPNCGQQSKGGWKAKP